MQFIQQAKTYDPKDLIALKKLAKKFEAYYMRSEAQNMWKTIIDHHPQRAKYAEERLQIL